MKLRYLGNRNVQLAGKCPHCLLVTTFDQQGVYTRSVSEPGVVPTVVVLFRCDHCSGPVVIQTKNLGNSVPNSVMPQARPTFPSPEYEQVVPKNVVEVMRQVYAGIEVQAWMLVGMGVRLVVELMSAERCSAHGIKLEQGLKARLRELQQKYPALEGPMQLADTIRLLGNEVAHDHNFICGSEQAAVAIELIEEMLETLYVLPARRTRLMSALPNKQDAIKQPA
ncbi:DUF4145 domain-containing protein [Vitiosangium sp. GDMCC 1.1324]|uniref:DUF4145 domain-containing protein n=1 Tax=Vitiosangium sp. (strain GDMCC 1.1324) TaxID=2138576 RepID=UPI000D3AC98A|nr:DUF4145 domain-containing protein [Vitiosangium sp. GDMCC 1.1324]